MVCVVLSDFLVPDIKANRTRDVKNNKKKKVPNYYFLSAEPKSNVMIIGC